MPYNLSIQQRNNKVVYCMTSKSSGKTYCYSSPAERSKGRQMHEMFKNIPKSKIRIVKK